MVSGLLRNGRCELTLGEDYFRPLNKLDVNYIIRLKWDDNRAVCRFQPNRMSEADLSRPQRATGLNRLNVELLQQRRPGRVRRIGLGDEAAFVAPGQVNREELRAGAGTGFAEIDDDPAIG